MRFKQGDPDPNTPIKEKYAGAKKVGILRRYADVEDAAERRRSECQRFFDDLEVSTFGSLAAPDFGATLEDRSREIIEESTNLDTEDLNLCEQETQGIMALLGAAFREMKPEDSPFKPRAPRPTPQDDQATQSQGPPTPTPQNDQATESQGSPRPAPVRARKIHVARRNYRLATFHGPHLPVICEIPTPQRKPKIHFPAVREFTTPQRKPQIPFPVRETVPIPEGSPQIPRGGFNRSRPAKVNFSVEMENTENSPALTLTDESSPMDSQHSPSIPVLGTEPISPINSQHSGSLSGTETPKSVDQPQVMKTPQSMKHNTKNKIVDKARIMTTETVNMTICSPERRISRGQGITTHLTGVPQSSTLRNWQRQAANSEIGPNTPLLQQQQQQQQQQRQRNTSDSPAWTMLRAIEQQEDLRSFERNRRRRARIRCILGYLAAIVLCIVVGAIMVITGIVDIIWLLSI